jgi:hypothetical protein
MILWALWLHNRSIGKAEEAFEIEFRSVLGFKRRYELRLLPELFSRGANTGA